MANGDDRKVYIVNFVLETPRRTCEEVLHNLPCRLERFRKRARAATVSIKPKNVAEVLDALAKSDIVVGWDLSKNSERD